jgi:hypothetical protein
MPYLDMGRPALRVAVLAAAVAWACTLRAQTAGSRHTITVKFVYDFAATPPCSATITAKCVQQFALYDISGGVAKRIKLTSIAVPSHIHGRVARISGTTPPLSFEPGKHLLAIVAQTPEGTESNPDDCTVWVEIH